jgi:peptide/nickel transport system permease protein
VATSQPQVLDTEMVRIKPRRSILSVVWQFAQQKPLGAAGGAVILVVIIVAIFASAIARYPYAEIHSLDTFAGPSGKYWLGTDNLGRDVFSRVIYGSRISLEVGIIAVGIGIAAGTFFGTVSGYFGGVTDSVIQRVMDSFMAFPALVLALTIVSMLGSDIVWVMLAIGITFTPSVARIVRGAVLSIKQNQYVEAAKTVGASPLRLVTFHILPNVTAPIIIIATAGLGGAIITEASLSFLGLGAPPPQPSWGGMLSGVGTQYFEKAPWLALSPGIAITLTVLGFNLLGDALRDVWDPRLRGTQ